MLDDLRTQLRRDEGTVLHVYNDSLGIPTIGIGRNLRDKGISQEEADYMLDNDIADVQRELAASIPWITRLDDARCGVLLNMAFNMGTHGLLQFKQTLAYVAEGDYDMAARQMLASKWATQVGARATRLSTQMSTGIWQ